MQQHSQQKPWANQMEKIPPVFSLSSNPNVGFGGLTEVRNTHHTLQSRRQISSSFCCSESLNQDKGRPQLPPNGRFAPVLQNHGYNLAPVQATDVYDGSWFANGEPVTIGAGADSWLHLPHYGACGYELDCWSPPNNPIQTIALTCRPPVFTGDTSVSSLCQSDIPITQPYEFQAGHFQDASSSLSQPFEGDFLHYSGRNSSFLANSLIPSVTNWQVGNNIPLSIGSMKSEIHNGTASYESFIGNDLQSCNEGNNLLSGNVNMSRDPGFDAADTFINRQLPAAQCVTVFSDVVPYLQDQYTNGRFIVDRSEPASFLPAFNSGVNAQYSSPGATIPRQAPSVLQQTPAAGYACTHPNCFGVFRRDSDRIRHAATAHNANNVGVHLCPIFGCIKSQGAGYSRADKVKGHLWKKHANLGYVKGRM